MHGTGEATPINLFHDEKDGTRIHLGLDAREAQIIVFSQGTSGPSLKNTISMR